MIIVDGKKVKIPTSMGPNYAIDFSKVNVTPETLKTGYVAYDKDGKLIHGTMEESEDAYWEDFDSI